MHIRGLAAEVGLKAPQEQQVMERMERMKRMKRRRMGKRGNEKHKWKRESTELRYEARPVNDQLGDDQKQKQIKHN